MNTPQPQRIFDASVVQDKTPQARYTSDSTQPDTADPTPVDRKIHGSEKRQTLPASSRLLPHIKRGIQQIVKARGKDWSESRVIAEACEAYLENDLGEKFGVRLAAHVTDAIERGLQKHSNKETSMSFKSYYSAEQNRIIAIQNLRFLLEILGVGLDELPLIISESQKEALANMNHHIRGDAKEQ